MEEQKDLDDLKKLMAEQQAKPASTMAEMEIKRLYSIAQTRNLKTKKRKLTKVETIFPPKIILTRTRHESRKI